MFARVGWAARAVAGRIQPANLAARAVGFDLPRSFAKLPTAAIKFKQPGSLLHELTAATDATSAHKLHESVRGGIAKLRREPDFVEKLVAFQALHGVTNAQLVTLCLQNGVAARMFAPEFNDAMKVACEEYSMSTAQLVTFLQDVTAKRLGEIEFANAMKALCNEHGMSTAQLVTFMSSSVAKRLGTAEFDEAVRVLLSQHSMSTAQLVTFMTNSVAKRLGTAEFDDAVNSLSNKYGMSTAQLVTFMSSNSVAKRLGTAEFDDAVKMLCKEYDMNTEQLVTFICGGAAKRLGTAEFDDAVKVLCNEYGMSTEQLVTFMSRGAAARLGTAEFDEALRVLLSEHRMSTAQLTTVMGESVAKRLGDEQFMSAMSKVIDCTDLACSVTLFSRNAFSSRIDSVVDDFCALAEHCQLNGSNAEELATMLGQGKLNSVIPQLWQRLSSLHGDNLQSSMAEYDGTYSHKAMKAKELMLS